MTTTNANRTSGAAHDAEQIKARSALRRVAWLREELERDDLQAVPTLRDAYENELRTLCSIPALRLAVVA